MAEANPEQLPRCEECDRPEMYWEVSKAETSGEQGSEKNINSHAGSLNFILGRQMESSNEKEHIKDLDSNNSDKETFSICPDPTCKEHLDTLSEITIWKLENDPNREYSDSETGEIIDGTMEQTIYDYKVINEEVDKISDDFDLDAEKNDGNKDAQNPSQASDTESSTEEALPQQQRWCEGCDKSERPREVSATDTTTEQELEKNTDGSTYSLQAAFSSIEVGGTKKTTTESVSGESWKFSTTDTAVFFVCSDRTCEERLITEGRVTSWKLRNDSTHTYTREEIRHEVRDVLSSNIQNNDIINERVESAHEMLSDGLSEVEIDNDSESAKDSESGPVDESDKKTSGNQDDGHQSDIDHNKKDQSFLDRVRSRFAGIRSSGNETAEKAQSSSETSNKQAEKSDTQGNTSRTKPDYSDSAALGYDDGVKEQQRRAEEINHSGAATNSTNEEADFEASGKSI